MKNFRWGNLIHLLVTFAVLTVAMPAFAQQKIDTRPADNPLVQLLESKGILTHEEAAQLGQAASADESNQRLAQLLLSKGLISQQEYAQTVSASYQPTTGSGSGNAQLVPAVLRINTGNTTVARAGSPAASPAPPNEPQVIPAVAPLRVLPIDVPKQGGLIPDIKLGSGAKMKLYGFFKVSAIEDTASSGGSTFGSNDFPLPLLLGDTGPTADPQFHIKARFFRIGSLFEWTPKDSAMTLTGRIEADNEGDYTNANNVNISSIRNSQLRLRLAWVRLDTKVGELPVFAEFGQDWSLISSTLPNLFETTGLGLGMASLYERVPMFRTGVQFSAGHAKIQPEFAIVLPVEGTASLTDEQRARFGDRAGAESNQPGIEGRLVFQFPISTSWKAVAPAQIIFSGHHARMNEIIPRGSLPNTAVPGATGCQSPLPGGACSVLSFFPTGLQLDSPQNVWTAEAQLPTPWVTFAAKYYNGSNLRWFFAGQLNDVFADLNGATAIPVASPITAFTNRVIPFGCVGATTTPTFSCNGNPVVASSLRSVRSQGGFGELSFPLSRIVNADPGGHNAGWVLHVSFSTDRVKAVDSRRANGLVRTDLGSGALIYKMNSWVTFVNEASYIDTRAATPGSKTFRGVPATQAHSWREEFGTVFTF
jgi:hypothetical protein